MHQQGELFARNGDFMVMAVLTYNNNQPMAQISLRNTQTSSFFQASFDTQYFSKGIMFGGPEEFFEDLKAQIESMGINDEGQIFLEKNLGSVIK